MIVEYGTIVELKGRQIASVLCQKQSACKHCPSSGACQVGDDGQSMLVEAFNVIGAEVGDKVKVVTTTKHFLQSSFILYIVPIIGLLIGAIAGQLIAENMAIGIAPALLSALLGVAFLIGTFLCIRVGTSALKREVFMPRIIEIQSEPDTQAKEQLEHGH
ncbi:MAG: SoxR reducing system RseC family protein [Geopsychrobacter sp.]|nr:SoxR reducing system RseC family protein [Geopsychrobacter sp.]